MRLLVDLRPIDPALGLAVEEALLDSVRQGGRETIRMWVNRQAVVVGRSQSVAAEVDQVQAQMLGVPILRRISGGGTVYHYPGNLNLSVFTRARPGLSGVSGVFEFYGHLLAEALGELVPELHAEDNGLYVGGLKVGGAAQAHRGDGILYHTTLLLQPSSVPMEALLLAMRPGYRWETIASRPRATTSLAEQAVRPIQPDELVGTITKALACALSMCSETGRLTPQEVRRATVLSRSKYGSPTWNQRW